MQLLCYLALTLLCGLSLSSSVAAITCNDTQYPWPLEKPKLCCNKCPPGLVTSANFVPLFIYFFSVLGPGGGCRSTMDLSVHFRYSSGWPQKLVWPYVHKMWGRDVPADLQQGFNLQQLWKLQKKWVVSKLPSVFPSFRTPVYNLANHNPFDGMKDSAAKPVCPVVIPSVGCLPLQRRLYNDIKTYFITLVLQKRSLQGLKPFWKAVSDVEKHITHRINTHTHCGPCLSPLYVNGVLVLTSCVMSPSVLCGFFSDHRLRLVSTQYMIVNIFRCYSAKIYRSQFQRSLSDTNLRSCSVRGFPPLFVVVGSTQREIEAGRELQRGGLLH